MRAGPRAPTPPGHGSAEAPPAAYPEKAFRVMESP
jgi:hypothetical protein